MTDCLKTKSGIIFDLDGVISDTQDMHSEVESEYLRDLNIHIHPEEITARFAGVGDEQMFATLLSEHKVNHRIDGMSQEKWRRMLLRIERDGIKPVAYVIQLIRLLYDSGFVLAIASGSPKSFIEQVMHAFSIEQYFSAYVSAEEVPHGKPAPDVFLEAARRASIDTRRCTIIEDGLSGMRAAASAQISCIGLVSDKTKNYPAAVLVTSLSEITVEKIMQLQSEKLAHCTMQK